MTHTRLSCIVCGVLGFWGYIRSDNELEIMRDAHQVRHGANHEVTWEKIN